MQSYSPTKGTLDPLITQEAFDMTSNRVNTKLSQADRDVVMTAVATIREKLPFLIDLSPEERKSLPKMGDKSRAFVSKSLEVATQNSDFLPRSFDIEECSRTWSYLRQCIRYCCR